MIEKKDILKMIKHVTARSHGRVDKRMIHPRREWVIGIGLFLLIVLGGASYNLVVYQGLTQIESTLTDTSTSVTKYKEAAVTTALQRYRAQQAAFTAIAGTAAPVPTTDVSPEESSLDEPDSDDLDSDSEELTEEDSAEAAPLQFE